MANILKGLDWNLLASYGSEEGINWRFTAPDSPWQNGCSESLIKSLKYCLAHAVGDHILSFSEIQTVAFEASNMLNERPIGPHPTSPDDGHYLCPNDFLLGRATTREPHGPFKEYVHDRQRFELVQLIASGFWKKMVNNYFPSLIVRQKWHTDHRNIAIDDIVLIQDTNAIRGQWKLGRVSEVEKSKDGHVRNCHVKYKLFDFDSSINKRFTTIRRAVQRLIVILLVEEDIAYNKQNN